MGSMLPYIAAPWILWVISYEQLLLPKILVESPRPANSGATGVAWNWAAVLAFRAGHPWDRLDITEKPWKTKGKTMENWRNT